jgi:HEAT repeat protein
VAGIRTERDRDELLPGGRTTVNGSTDPLINRLSHESPTVRVAAARELGASRPATGAAVRALTDALRDPDWLVAAAAAGSLGKIGHAAGSSASALVMTLGHPDPAVRRSAEDAMGGIEEVDHDALRAMEERSATDASPEVRDACAASLRLCRAGLIENPKARIAPLLLGLRIARLISQDDL